MKEIIGIDHVSITVKDMDQSLEFYLQVIGCTLVHRRMISGGEKELALLDLHGQFIELIKPQNNQPIPETSGHLGLKVSDIYGAVENLRKVKGIEFVNEEPLVVVEGMVIFFFKGFNGELIELVQPPKSDQI